RVKGAEHCRDSADPEGQRCDRDYGETRIPAHLAKAATDVLKQRIHKPVHPRIERQFCDQCAIAQLTASSPVSLARWHTRFHQALFSHSEMELQFLISSRIKAVPGEQSRQTNAHVNPQLTKHYDTTGSMTRLIASTTRRQLEILTPTCLR